MTTKQILLAPAFPVKGFAFTLLRINEFHRCASGLLFFRDLLCFLAQGRFIYFVIDQQWQILMDAEAF
jgi:hypothetical protein